MARRFSAPYQSEPVSSLATWARNLAIFSVVAVVVSIVIVRFGFLEMKPALATFFGALACAALRANPMWVGGDFCPARDPHGRRNAKNAATRI